MRLKHDWANLEALPLSLILDNLEERIDHVWFGAVCKNWQSIAKLNQENHQFKTNTLPMLVIPTQSFCKETHSFIQKERWLYGIPNKTWYPFKYQLCANPKLRLIGSSYGWLALVDDSTSIITLMNPFKDIPHIILPPLNSADKVTLSADPIKYPNDYVVVAIYKTIHNHGLDIGNLAFIRRGQTLWTYIDSPRSCFVDAMFYKGLLFALDICAKIVSFNFGCSNDYWDKKTITSNVVLEKNRGDSLNDKYLVKSLEEELWVVKRCDKHRSAYRVYKLQLDAKSEKVEQMIELKYLGDNVLFLGAGDSISVSVSYFFKCLQRDSIYFASFLKIYDLKSEKFTLYSIEDARWKSKFWILPRFKWN